MKKIKVLFAIPNLKTAGSGREMINIVDKLDKNIFEPWIGVSEPGGALLDEVIARRFPLVVQPFLVKESLGLPAKLKAARAYARDFKPLEFNIWQSFNWSSDFSEALVARQAGAAYVYVKKNMNWGRKAWKAKSFLSKAIVARNSTMMQTFFAEKKYRNKVQLITGGVDTNVFMPRSDMSAREEYGIPANAFMISCVAQIVRSKDQDTLIKAVSRIDNVYLVLAGAARDESYLAELEALIKQYNLGDRVKIAGTVADVNGLLNASNAFVLPTSDWKGHEEGCPVSVLEAMAAGTPCIVSNVAGNSDLIEHGKTGLIFKQGNVDSLADCIREFITKPSYPASLAEKALDKVYAEYTIEKEAAAFAALYQKLAR